MTLLSIFTQAFWESFWANVIATLIGAAVGFGIALYFDRRSKLRQAGDARKAKLQQDNEAEKLKRARSKRVLELLKAELQENIVNLEQLHFEIEHWPKLVRSESWRAFSEGGELQNIDDPTLLATIADAYAATQQYDVLYKQYIDIYFRFKLMSGWKEQINPFFLTLVKFRDGCKEKVVEAVRKIDTQLSKQNEVILAQP